MKKFLYNVWLLFWGGVAAFTVLLLPLWVAIIIGAIALLLIID